MEVDKIRTDEFREWFQAMLDADDLCSGRVFGYEVKRRGGKTTDIPLGHFKSPPLDVGSLEAAAGENLADVLQPSDEIATEVIRCAGQRLLEDAEESTPALMFANEESIVGSAGDITRALGGLYCFVFCWPQKGFFLPPPRLDFVPTFGSRAVPVGQIIAVGSARPGRYIISPFAHVENRGPVATLHVALEVYRTSRASPRIQRICIA